MARPRKTARTVTAAPPQVEAPPVAGVVDIPTPDALPGGDRTPTGRARRSYKAELDELRRRLAVQQETKIEPKDLLPVTAGLLQVTAAAIKGDDPLPGEIDRCNDAICAVANKYGATFRYWEEVVLVLALGTTAVSMKQRSRERERADKAASSASRPPLFPNVFPNLAPPPSES